MYESNKCRLRKSVCIETYGLLNSSVWKKKSNIFSSFFARIVWFRSMYCICISVEMKVP